MFCHVQRNITSRAANNHSFRKRSPHPWWVKTDITNVFEVGKLNFVLRRKRNTPTQAHSVDVFRCTKVDDDPLCMKSVGIAGEMLVQIRITFPERVRVTIIEARVAVIFCLVDSAATPREVVTVGEHYGLS